MSDFESELEARLARNAELAAERARAEAELERAREQAEAEARQRELDLAQARREHHAQLAALLERNARRLKDAAQQNFVVRMGWTESHDEFIVKISSRTLTPARTLFIELDRDDDEVLARWTTDIGNTIELWRLLQVEPSMLGELLLQATDQEYWATATAPPPFPRP